jgi:ubiquinone/menaquinone biosynthesis C-methylase UbiE
MDYEKETRSAYRNMTKAANYKKQIAEKITWARFAMWRERRIIRKALRSCDIGRADALLDIPCGTGILTRVLSSFSDIIVGSDISREMMDFARKEYQGIPVCEFIQADITAIPFKKGVFRSVLILGFMHRVPAEIRTKTLQEMAFVSNAFIIISYSVQDALQRCKREALKRFLSSYKSAPAAASIHEIVQEFKANDLSIHKKYRVAPFLSSEVVFLLKKKV